MPRFDRLEIGPGANEPQHVGQAAAPVDEQFHPAKQADRHRRSGNYENALRFYSRALEADKSFIAGWVGQVEMLIMLDEVPEADLWCRKALEVFPGNGELLAARTRALCRLGDLRQAGAVSDAALAAQGRSALRWMARGEWMVASRQPLDRHCFDKARELDADWLVPLETALIYQHYSFPSQGLARARLATELAPDQAYPWYVRGDLEAALGMTRPATTSFTHCLQLCPGHVEAGSRLAQVRRSKWSIRRLFRRLMPGK
jgi:tetratricopeptide (TPR) repeat protein